MNLSFFNFLFLADHSGCGQICKSPDIIYEKGRVDTREVEKRRRTQKGKKGNTKKTNMIKIVKHEETKQGGYKEAEGGEEEDEKEEKKKIQNAEVEEGEKEEKHQLFTNISCTCLRDACFHSPC